MVANPRKLKKPTISVTVVSTIEDDWAGSCPATFKSIGITAPDNPAMAMEMIMEMPITRDKPSEFTHRKTIREVVKATAIPLKVPTISSFFATLYH